MYMRICLSMHAHVYTSACICGQNFAIDVVCCDNHGGSPNRAKHGGARMAPSPPWGPTVGCTQWCRKLPLSFYLKLVLSYFGASCLSRDFSASRAPRGQPQEEVRPTSLSTTSPVPAARAERRRKRRSGRLRSIRHMLACLEGLASSAHLQRTTTRTASLLVRVTTSLHGKSCHFTSWHELPLHFTSGQTVQRRR